jgi:hypothetical protein
LANVVEAMMALRHIKSYLCDGCGRSTEQICEIWTLGSKEYCSRHCLDADRLKAASRESSSRAYIGCVFIVALLTFAFAATPRARAQDNDHHLYHADYYSKWHQPGSAASCCNGRETKDGTIMGDCAPTKAEVRQGSWWAKLQDSSEWVQIPDERIIRERNPTPEQAHLCYLYGKVLCFVPPNTGT